MSPNLRGEYAKIAAAHARAQEDKARLPLAAARGNALKLDWSGAYRPPKPTFLGSKALGDYPIGELGRLHRLDAVLHDLGIERQIPRHSRRREIRRPAARSLYEDAQAMLDKIVAERWFKASAAFGFWPANAQGDDIQLYADETRGESDRGAAFACASNCPSARAGHNVQRSAISSRRATAGLADYIGAFAVTAGIGEDEVADRFKRANDDYSAILVKALADRLAEAFAERLHARVRREFWGYAADETLTPRN